MEHIQLFEQFILREADDSFDFETFLNHEVAIYTRCMDNITRRKQMKILVASGQSSLLALGLALQGHHVYSTKKIDVDLPESLQLSMMQTITDFQWHQQDKFDAVLLSHNAISEYLTEAELDQTLDKISNVLENNGLLLISTCFYDRLLRLQPQSNHQQFIVADKRCIQLSVWDWLCKNECTYLQNHYVIQQIGEECVSYHNCSRHRAWRRAELNMALSQMGFVSIQYHSVANDQMLICAIKR